MKIRAAEVHWFASVPAQVVVRDIAGVHFARERLYARCAGETRQSLEPFRHYAKLPGWRWGSLDSGRNAVFGSRCRAPRGRP